MLIVDIHTDIYIYITDTGKERKGQIFGLFPIFLSPSLINLSFFIDYLLEKKKEMIFGKV